jgi:GT2 family glycosyltransferase
LEVIYVIIVTYNGTQWIDKCQGKLYQSEIGINIILVDNLSTDGTLDFVKTDIHKLF